MILFHSLRWYVLKKMSPLRSLYAFFSCLVLVATVITTEHSLANRKLSIVSQTTPAESVDKYVHLVRETQN